MNTRLLSIFALLVFLPGSVLAARPQITGIKQEVVRLSQAVQDLREDLAATRRELAATRSELAAVRRNSVLELGGIVSLKLADDGSPTVIIEGVNLQLVNGLGITDAANGLGNIIVGYNRNEAGFGNQQGSHNIVLGDGQGYPGNAELITGGILSSRDLSIVVTRDMSTLVGLDQSTAVGGNQSLSVGANHSETIGGSQSTSVGSNKSTSVGANESRTIGGNAGIDIGKDLTVGSGMAASITAGDEIVLKTGKASATMKKNGDITIDGKDINVKGSGDVVIKGSKILEN